jgi:molecular chaperone HtpG
MMRPSFIAVANSKGADAPKTNVARSTLEITPQRDALYSTLYKLYVQHVSDEIDRLMTKENYSLTWSVNNAVMLVPFNLSEDTQSDAVLPNALRDRMKTLPIYIVEKSGARTNISFDDLIKEETFWTVDSELVRSAEQLVREAKTNATVSGIVTALGDKALAHPTETVLYNIDVSHILRDAVEGEFEPREVTGDAKLRRSAIRWSARTASSWTRVDDVLRRVRAQPGTQREVRLNQVLQDLGARRGLQRGGFGSSRIANLWLASPEVPFKGIDGLAGVTSLYRTFLRGDIKVTQFLREVAGRDDSVALQRLQVFSTIYLAVAPFDDEHVVPFAVGQLRRISEEVGSDVTEGQEAFLEALSSSPTALFDTSVWSQRRMW